jgi:hypothetical protein
MAQGMRPDDDAGNGEFAAGGGGRSSSGERTRNTPSRVGTAANSEKLCVLFAAGGTVR